MHQRSRQTDIRDRRSSLSPLCSHHDTAGAVDSSGYPWRPRLSDGCNAVVEQSATRDSGLLFTRDISEGAQVSPFPSVIRLTCAVRWDRRRTSALSCATVLDLNFVKCLRNCCDGITLYINICSSRQTDGFAMTRRT